MPTPEPNARANIAARGIHGLSESVQVDLDVSIDIIILPIPQASRA